MKEATDAGDGIAFSPRTTSLSVVRAQTQQDAAEERFFRKLDEEVRTLCKDPDIESYRSLIEADGDGNCCKN